jgi:hypothetical protein
MKELTGDEIIDIFENILGCEYYINNNFSISKKRFEYLDDLKEYFKNKIVVISKLFKDNDDYYEIMFKIIE